ncbi:MAG: radical SAM protein [Ruminiclostridium sp.]|nr:radical SAM protein [Ruminiclostridium sp.]
MHYKFKYPKLFDGVEHTDFTRLSGKLVIYGAGFQGLLTAFLLKKQGINVICFADIDEKKQGTIYYGLPVISPQELKEKYSDKTVIVTPYGLENVWTYLKNDLCLNNLVTPFSLFLDFDSKEFDKLSELPKWYHSDTIELNIEKFLIKCVNILTDKKIYNLEISVTEKCSLKCKNCMSFMPCYEKPFDFEYEDVLSDVLKMVGSRQLHIFNIEGGEPFMWKPLADLVNELCKLNNIMRIVTITNGTIIPDDKLLEALSNPKVAVRISDYGKFSKIDALIKEFSKRNIKYWVQLQVWNELSAYSIDENDSETMNRIVTSCCKLQPSGSAYSMGGKLYLCPSQANLDRLGIFKSEEESYIDLRVPDTETMQKKIDRFLEMRPVAELCRHCDGRGFTNKEVPPAEQLAPGEKLVVSFE